MTSTIKLKVDYQAYATEVEARGKKVVFGPDEVHPLIAEHFAISAKHLIRWLLDHNIDRVPTMLLDYLVYLVDAVRECVLEPKLSSLISELEARRYKKNTLPRELLKHVEKVLDDIIDVAHDFNLWQDSKDYRFDVEERGKVEEE